MYYRMMGAVVILLMTTEMSFAQDDADFFGESTGQGPVGQVGVKDDAATLESLTEHADRITLGQVGTMRRVLENHVVHTQQGQPITGTFVFTYVDLTPTEHIVGDSVGTVTVRVLGGLHPDGSKFTTYADAPSLASEEQVLVFLEETPERGPNEELVHQIAYHRAGKFRVEGEGAAARLVRDLPNSALEIDASEGIGENPIPLEKMKALIRAERADD